MENENIYTDNRELKHLVMISNVAFLAFNGALLFAGNTPEFERLKAVNEDLRRAIVRAENHLKTTTRQ